MFNKYQHVENNFNSPEVAGILKDQILIQVKLDGSNCQMYLEDGEIVITSRNRVLDIRSDNANCYKTLIKLDKYKQFFAKYPNCKLCGEWLVPHKINYINEAYHKFYVFDIIDNTSYDKNGGCDYIPFDIAVYEMLKPLAIEYVDYRLFDDMPTDLFDHDFTKFLLPEGADGGEGVVVKNYNWKNNFGRSTWVKIINTEVYKSKNYQKVVNLNNLQEYGDAENFINKNKELINHLISKCYYKIEGFDNTKISQFIKDCQNELITDFNLDELNIKKVFNLLAKECIQFLKRI